MITYRKAHSADIPVLTALRLQFLKEVYPHADTTKDPQLTARLHEYLTVHLPNGTFVNWFAEDNGVPVASAGIVFYQQPPLYHNLSGSVAYILNVYTLPSHRKQGIARQLFERILEEARQRDTGKISLHASVDGRHLYEQFGFEAGDNEMTLQLKVGNKIPG